MSGRRHSILLALFVVAVEVLAGGVSAEEGGRPVWAALLDPTEGWRLVEERRSVPRASEPVGMAEAAWVWSQTAPPRRVDPVRWREELESLRLGTASDRAGRLVVHLPEPCRPSCPDLRVVAAPKAMWQQVQEPWLPSWPVPEDGRVVIPRTHGEPWRVRLIGDDRGSWWQDVEGSEATVVVRPVAARMVALLVRSTIGEALESFEISVMVHDPSGYRPEILARFRSADGAEVALPALPVDARAVFVAGAPGRVGTAFVARGDELPRPMLLPAAARVEGRFVDRDGRPVAGVEVTGEGWMSPHAPIPSVARATSDESGGWILSPLPAGQVAIEGAKPGTRSYRAGLELRNGDAVDLGDLEIGPGDALRVLVVDDQGAPVAGAEVASSEMPRRSIPSDRQGRATLPGLAPDSRVEVRVAAAGFLPSEAIAAAPWPDPFEVRLRNGLRVTGAYAAADGMPVADGAVRIETGSTFRSERLGAAGDFDLLLEPDLEHVLSLGSRETAETRVGLEAGVPGEHRDLGTIRAAPGLVASGQVLSGVDGAPVAGARVWTPRLRDQGAVVAWALGDTIATSSDAAGMFRLSGLAVRPVELIVEAAGFARRYLEVLPVADEASIDLGVVELSPGATVAVDLSRLQAAEGEVEARLDLRRRWQDQDMLIAAVVEGQAEFVQVPPGSSLVTVLTGGEIVCEEPVEVPEDEQRVEVACEGSGGVSGSVLVGGRPAGPGTLIWQPPEVPGLDAGIFNLTSSRGVRQQRPVGIGRPAVRVEVADDGSFSSDRVGAGRWRVSLQPTGGDLFAPLAAEVSAGGVAGLLLRFEGVVVAGRVTDEEGVALGGAVVQVVGSAATAMTSDDGSFRLAGVAEGVFRLQARWRDRYSAAIEVTLDPDHPPAEVELMVRRGHSGRISVVVSEESGAPASGAFVFYESDASGATRVVSADRDGTVALSFAEPHPSRIRLAAFADGTLSLGRWVEWKDAVEGVSLSLLDTGSLTLSVEGEAGGPIRLLSADGWDLSRLFAVLGLRPQVVPGTPLSVGGLPPGEYSVGLEDGLRAATVEAGRARRVRLD